MSPWIMIVVALNAQGKWTEYPVDRSFHTLRSCRDEIPAILVGNVRVKCRSLKNDPAG